MKSNEITATYTQRPGTANVLLIGRPSHHNWPGPREVDREIMGLAEDHKIKILKKSGLSDLLYQMEGNDGQEDPRGKGT